MFQKFIVDCTDNIFEVLSTGTKFEDVCKGRSGANLTECKDNVYSLVRTTTCYKLPNQKFLPVHYDIIDNVKKVSGLDVTFNNALAEIYNWQYKNMAFHSDQALDLKDNSYICIFSCYNIQDKDSVRKLKIKHKTTGQCDEIIMEHGSVVIFSTDTNKQYVHKIILDKGSKNCKWLGITFRLSKTFIEFIDNKPYFYGTDIMLRLINDKKEFIKNKSNENLQNDYVPEDIDYTISVGDMLPIK